jgi:hypothetical protein
MKLIKLTLEKGLIIPLLRLKAADLIHPAFHNSRTGTAARDKAFQLLGIHSDLLPRGVIELRRHLAALLGVIRDK